MLSNILKNPVQDSIKLVSILKSKVLESTAKLKESEERYRSLIEGLNLVGIGIDIVDRDYNVLFQNNVLKERFGNIANKLCYEKYMDLKEPCEFCPMIKAIKNNQVESEELIAGDGRNYKLISAPYPNRDGTIDKAVEVVLDISEQKGMEKEFKESEEKFRNITEQSLMGIAILQDDLIIYATKRLAEIYGCPLKKC